MQLDGSKIFFFHEETPSEKKLARELSRRGVSFMREAPIRNYTVDFLIDNWLVVEVDGESHIPTSRRREDLRRQRDLETLGFTVVRVPSRDLFDKRRTACWVDTILSELKHQTKRKPGLEASRRRALAAGQHAMEERRRLALSPPSPSLPGSSSPDVVTPASTSSGRHSIVGRSGSLRRSREPTMAELFGPDSLSFAELLGRSRWFPEDFRKDEDFDDEGPDGRKARNGNRKRRRK
ncbi:MAG TPA: DUF559 domain-containing protein [Firmicutes bacterium]|nr:DUF559 domain-containing protein [Candidatus Fermentithermobacillaceae bacterium]